MKRAFGFLFRNWPLKLGAVVLASVLYGGLVLSQSARVWEAGVPIEPLGQPRDAFLLETLPEIRTVTYFAPADVAARLTRADFSATVDLSQVDTTIGGAPVFAPVRVEPVDRRVRVLDWFPREIPVRLDPIVTRPVDVRVDRGPVPDGLTISPERVTPRSVRIRGPSSLVARVSEAVARVRIDPTGVNVDRDVDLVAVDEGGSPIDSIDVEPAQVHVLITVSPVVSTKAVPVIPELDGQPAIGFRVRRVVLDPAVVTIRGDATRLEEIDSIATEPLPIADRRDPLDAAVGLVLPEGITVVDDEQVRATVEIEAETASRTFSIGVVLTGARADRIYRLSVDQVTVTLSGTVAALSGVTANEIVGTVPVSNLAPGTHRIAVRIRVPAGTTLESVNPVRVVVTIEVPARPTPSPTPEPEPEPEPTPTPAPTG